MTPIGQLLRPYAAVTLLTFGVWLALGALPVAPDRAAAQSAPDTFVLVNDTGEYASGLHIHGISGPAFELVANAPNCPAPRIVRPFIGTGDFPNARQLLWPDACVAPGDSVTYRLFNDSHILFTITAPEVWVWSRDGMPLLSSPTPHTPPPRSYLNDTGQAADALFLPELTGFLFVLADPPGCSAPRIDPGGNVSRGGPAMLRWDAACVAPGESVTVLFARPPDRRDAHVWTRTGLVLRPGDAPASGAAAEPAPSGRDGGILNQARTRPTAVLLPDGRVLMVGGFNAMGGWTTAGDLFDPATGVWTPTAPTQTSYPVGITVTVLRTGRVMLLRSNCIPELYEPATDRWTRTSDLPRGLGLWLHTELLPDGRVLVFGDEAAAVYDPVADHWTPTGLGAPKEIFRRTVILPDGRVLVLTPGNAIEPLPASGPLDRPFRGTIYDPTTNTWTTASPGQRLASVWGAWVLPDGRILAVGSLRVDDGGRPYLREFNAEVYDPATDIWTLTERPEQTRGYSTGIITRLPDGRVLLMWGDVDRLGNAVRIYDPQTIRWGEVEAPRAVRALEWIVRLPDGRVLLLGTGYGFAPVAEVFDPATLTWGHPARLTRVREVSTATLLRDGSVLVTDGTVAEIYDPPPAGNSE